MADDAPKTGAKGSLSTIFKFAKWGGIGVLAVTGAVIVLTPASLAAGSFVAGSNVFAAETALGATGEAAASVFTEILPSPVVHANV